MKSIYLDNELHSQLKTLASLEKRSLSDLVKEFLSSQLKRKLSDLPTPVLQKLAEQGASFDFLNNPEEDIYNDRDGLSLP